MELKRYNDFLINEAKKNMSDEDAATMRKIRRARERLRGHHPQDDCPLGAPYGGYTVSDTRRALTQMKKRIDNKYKTQADYDKEKIKWQKDFEKRSYLNKMFDKYKKAIKNSLTEEEKLIDKLYWEGQSNPPVPKQYNSFGFYSDEDTKNRIRQTLKKRNKFKEKVAASGLKMGDLKDMEKYKMKYEIGIINRTDFEKALKNITSENPEKKWMSFYKFIVGAPEFAKFMEPLKGTYGALKFNLF